MDNDPDHYVRMYEEEQRRSERRMGEIEPPIWTSVLMLVGVVLLALTLGFLGVKWWEAP